VWGSVSIPDEVGCPLFSLNKKKNRFLQAVPSSDISAVQAVFNRTTRS
jgi:hypothetical protein